MIFLECKFPNTDKRILDDLERERKASSSNSSGWYNEPAAKEINEMLSRIENRLERTFYVFISRATPEVITVMAAYRPEKKNFNDVRRDISEIFTIPEDAEMREVTISEFAAALDDTRYSEKPSARMLDELEANINPRDSFFEPRRWTHEEMILSDDKPSKAKVYNRAKKILASESMMDELDRIYSTDNKRKYYGNPVHYYICAGTRGAANDMINLLLLALRRNGRLRSSRVLSIRDMMPNATGTDNFRNIFNASIGSTLVIDLSNDSFVSGNYATGYQKNAEFIGKQFGVHGKDTLFIFVEIDGKSEYKDETLAAILGNGDIIRIEEGFGNFDQASEYLNELVEKSEFSEFRDEDMSAYLPDQITFTVSDIYEAYGKWYGNGLKTHVYKAYRNVDRVKITVKRKVAEPYKELGRMVGLTEIKGIVDQIISRNRIQKLRYEMGFEDVSASRHMVFYGNPGTAKTTVARLISQILKEEGVLEHGHLVECGRQDLVARYVGWTAKTVQEKFDAARGGVLFIDEAYSLLEEHNSFGTEAINTIVQLMENYRDEVIVIFAGYPDKMKKFIEGNEGLASRIAFHLNFPDYNAEELAAIMDLMLEKHNYTMDEEARAKCLEVFESVKDVPNFGNGRFVRNFLEQAELRQSGRLMEQCAGEEMTREEMMLIRAEDIEPEYSFLQTGSTPARKIGLIA